jgi:uncharacterized protein (DUF488 family)
MRRFDLFSIGHSNIPIDHFVGMLHGAGANAVVDVRSTPVSLRCPWFSAKNLVTRLQQERMLYLSFGEALGGRPRDPALYRHGAADYEAMAERPAFSAALARLLAQAVRRRLCLMCAEREPLDCHRCLLVARALAERDVAVGHILHDGTIEPHTATEQRLLAWSGPDADLFVAGQRERLAAAYRRRTRAVAYRAKPSSKPGSRARAQRRPAFRNSQASAKR